MPAATRRSAARTALGLLAVAAALLAGCTDDAPAASPRPTDGAWPVTAGWHQAMSLPTGPATVVPGDGSALAVATSVELFDHADAVVVTDPADAVAAAGVARRLVAPVLLAPADQAERLRLEGELRRLGTGTIVVVGDAAAQWAAGAGPLPAAHVVTGIGSAFLPHGTPAPDAGGLLVLALPGDAAAAATAAAAGARVVTTADPDPRADPAAIAALAGADASRVLALGSAFGAPDRVRSRVAVAATGVELPGGGQRLLPGRHLVALYGNPTIPALGSLGEQDLAGAIRRVTALADEYRPAFGETTVPAFEIITTIASASAGKDGDYSTEVAPDSLRPWIEAAAQAGIYVVLDLQPGRTDFLTQARRYEGLLAYPNVGLALDPEWRLGPDQFHLKVVGHVSAAEINATGAWLEDLTARHRLPQKLFMIHEWKLSMITERSTLDTDYDDLAVVIHVDGFGTQSAKQETWRAVKANAPAGLAGWGWKNFIDEDQPMLTPEETVAQVHPSPVFVSYQ